MRMMDVTQTVYGDRLATWIMNPCLNGPPPHEISTRDQHGRSAHQTSASDQRSKPEQQTEFNIAFFMSQGTLWWAAVLRR